MQITELLVGITLNIAHVNEEIVKLWCFKPSQDFGMGEKEGAWKKALTLFWEGGKRGYLEKSTNIWQVSCHTHSHWNLYEWDSKLKW